MDRADARHNRYMDFLTASIKSKPARITKDVNVTYIGADRTDKSTEVAILKDTEVSYLLIIENDTKVVITCKETKNHPVIIDIQDVEFIEEEVK